MKKVGIWLRVSTDMQAQSDSPKHHEHRARAYAEAKGWTVQTVYHLEAVSGKNVMAHPEAMRMLQDIQMGKISGIIFSKIARLARNTVQLLNISKQFQEHKADLISLEESIDTSSPAGRFFFTIISAIAEWEREEIASRVKASVKTRAHLGKTLGGQAPFGYSVVNKELVLNEQEAPIRKLMFELYKEHKRKKTVCTILNDKGYRTRKGSLFTPPTLTRLLSNPIAKGMRRVNYTESLGQKKHWKLKPKEEWIFQEAPVIVSEELWQEVNDILTEQQKKSNYPKNTKTHLFTGTVFCDCGGEMTFRSTSPRYVCKKCKRKIRPDDLEHIFYDTLKENISNEMALKTLNKEHAKNLSLEKELLQTLQKKEIELEAEMKQLLELNRKGELPTNGFKKHYTPIYEQHESITETIKEKTDYIASFNDIIETNILVINEAKELYKSWLKLSSLEKRHLIESITKRITVGDSDIHIELNGLMPLRPESMADGVHNNKDSCSPPT